MNEIIIELKIIEGHYLNANYLRSYEMLFYLCGNKDCCEHFSQSAMSILTQYNDWKNNRINQVDALSQQDMKKRQICTSFEQLLIDMKRYFDPQCSFSTYDDEAVRIKEQREMLRKSQMRIEDDLTECGNPDKAKILKTILAQLRIIIDSFWELMKKFQAVREYE